MIDLNSIVESFQTIFSIQILLIILLGSALGIIIGALPGLGPTVGTTLMLPIAFDMPTIPAIILLISIYVTAEYGGSITAILISTPGTTAATATVEDGYPLTLKGEPGKALGASLVGSTIGGIMTSFVLLIFAIPLMKFALKFGPTEYFALGFFGLSLVASLSGKSILKGLLMAIFGLLLATVGIDHITGYSRFTFDSVFLYDGISLLPALMGLYAVSEIIIMFLSGENKMIKEMKEKMNNQFIKLKEVISLLPVIFQSGIIGAIVGVLPGAGGSIGSWIAYDQSKRIAKDKEEYGKGALSGVAAPETANNATVGGALVPLLSLGIPGSPTTAVLLGALIFHGVSTGPDLIQKDPVLFYGIVLSMLVTSVFMFVLGYTLKNIWIKIIKLPNMVIAPIILAIAVIGTYSINNMMFDVYVMLIFGIIGFFLRKFDFPLAPIVLALVLGEIMESNFRRALMISDGSWLIFFTKPISLILILIAVMSFMTPIFKKIYAMFNSNKEISN